MQLGLQKSAELPDVPLIIDQATNDEQRQILRLVFSRQEFAWPFAAPPDIPADRQQALRDAFAATLQGSGIPRQTQERSRSTSIRSPPCSREADRRSLRDAGIAILAKVRSVTTSQ